MADAQLKLPASQQEFSITKNLWRCLVERAGRQQ